MIKLLVLLAVWNTATADEFADRMANIINDIEVQDNSCKKIDGNLSSGCYECYPCDHERVQKFSTQTVEIKLNDSKCSKATSTLCCIPQNTFTVREADNCGIAVPKTAKRKNIRSVVDGEHPWRAWVFHKLQKKLLCAGTFVDETVNGFVTLASCVKDFAAENLVVLESRVFVDTNGYKVDTVIIHEDYKSDKPDVNNIVLLKLSKVQENGGRKHTHPRSRPIHKYRRACRPDYPPMQPTPCIVVSHQDYFINTVIPIQKNCYVNDYKPHISQLCATAPPGDYEPEIGAGLYCRDELRTGRDQFYIFGITINTNGPNTLYTNVTHFSSWISDKIFLNKV